MRPKTSTILAGIALTLTLFCGKEQAPEQPRTGPVSIFILQPDGSEPAPMKLDFEQGTVLELMKKAAGEGLLTIDYRGDGEKAFIQSINGTGPTGETKQDKYWIYAINGKPAALGVGSQQVNAGDTIKWCYLSYDNRDECADE
jgi:hypothetical protein